MSTSTKIQTSLDYMLEGEKDGKMANLLWRIRAKPESSGGFHHGADISTLSQYQAEEEILFPPCTILTVVESAEASVQLDQEVEPLSDLLKRAQEIIREAAEAGKPCTVEQSKVDQALDSQDPRRALAILLEKVEDSELSKGSLVRATSSSIVVVSDEDEDEDEEDKDPESPRRVERQLSRSKSSLTGSVDAKQGAGTRAEYRGKSRSGMDSGNKSADGNPQQKWYKEVIVEASFV